MKRLCFAIKLNTLILVFLFGWAQRDCLGQHPIVVGFERFIDVEKVDEVQRGLLLLNELNCYSCHKTDNSFWSVPPKKAPVLSNVGNRLQHKFYQQFLADPHQMKPGTTMPDVLADLAADQKQETIENLAHFMASLGQLQIAGSNQQAARLGEQLFHSIGCVACHDPQNEKTTFANSIPFGELDKKYTLPGLIGFLKTPYTVRPSGRMPDFNLNDNQAKNIASYLLRDLKVEGNVNYRYYEGAWEKLPDFDALQPTASGTVVGLDIKFGAADDFGIVFEGYWETKADADYKFRLTSDDGSRLIINNQRIIDNDGVHPMKSIEKTVNLPAGVHEVRVEFFERQGGEDIKLTVAGNGIKNLELGFLLRPHRETVNKQTSDSFQIDSAKVSKGRIAFTKYNCVRCHSLENQNDLPESWSELAKPVGAAAKNITELNPAKGCVNGTPPAPRFNFSSRQKTALVAAINFVKQQSAAIATNVNQRIHQNLLTNNCYACHSREFDSNEIVGGVLDQTGESQEIFGRQKWFTSDQPEMGDEGRLPPYLKEIGAKLNKDWLKHVLSNGANDRPYMKTRMPKYGGMLADLATDFVEADKLDEVISVERTVSPRKLKLHGKAMVGGKALSCVKCHTFANHKATGIQAMSLTTMTKRLDKNWFHAYMRKPSRFRRGTRMPESWPGGKSFFPDMLNGDPDQQIDAMWVYLADGDKAEVPPDLIQSQIELIPAEHPVIYRNFIEGAGPRAIGVGYPEKVNLAFDAENSRMALLWQGKFIDAGRHWNGRGQGFQRPLGGNVLALPIQDPFIIFNPISHREKYVPPKLKFGGYKFDQHRRPTFLYSLNGISIEDTPLPVVIEDRATLTRKFIVDSKQSTSLWYRAASGKKIEKVESDYYLIDGDWKTKIIGTDAFVLKHENEVTLFVLLNPSKGPREFIQVYEW